MATALDHSELRRRSLEGLRAELGAFGSGGAGARVLELGGVIAAVSPGTPERSIFNSVYAPEPDALLDRYEELARAYAEAGVHAWTVWLDPEAGPPGEQLARRGHELDGSPRLMAMPLGTLPDAPPADARDVEVAEPGECARVNDLAYELAEPAWAIALAGETEPPLRWWAVRDSGAVVGCAGTIDFGDDVVVTGVATLSSHRGRGLAGAILHAALADAAGRGMLTATLQASAAGAPVYERLGFADFGPVELWERRREPGA